MRLASFEVAEGRGHALDRVLRRSPSSRPMDRLPHAPTLQSLAALAERVRATPVDRAAVVAAQRRHNADLGNPATESLCARLGDPQSLVVMTGQQPGPFGGPLMVMAKIAGAVLLARQLEAFVGTPVVPVFWNLSEDHDLEEVNRIERLDGPTVTRVRLPIEDRGRCLDHLRIDEEMAARAREELDHFGVSVTPDGLLPEVGRSWPRWTSRSLLALLGDTLPILHAEPRYFRHLLGDLYRDALTTSVRFGDALRAGSEALHRVGFTPQIAPGDPSQLFVLARDGTRVRLSADGGWALASPIEDAGDDPLAFALRLCDEDPSRLSGNVVMRPLAQQRLFPVVAHVNGPAEVAYFGQFPEVFAAAGLPLPAVIPRPSVTLVGPRQDAARSALGLDDAALYAGPATWPEPSADDELTAVFAALRAGLDRELSRFDGVADEDGLVRAVAGFQKRVEAAVATLEKTFVKDRERRAGVGKDRRERLATWLFPKGKPQERMVSPLSLLRGGDPTRLATLLAGIDPLDFRHHLIFFDRNDVEA